MSEIGSILFLNDNLGASQVINYPKVINTCDPEEEFAYAHCICSMSDDVMSHQGRAPLLLRRSATRPAGVEASLQEGCTASPPPPPSSSSSSASLSSSSPSSSVFSAWLSSSWLCFSWLSSFSSLTFHRSRRMTKTRRRRRTRKMKNFSGASSSWF